MRIKERVTKFHVLNTFPVRNGVEQDTLHDVQSNDGSEYSLTAASRRILAARWIEPDTTLSLSLSEILK